MSAATTDPGTPGGTTTTFRLMYRSHSLLPAATLRADLGALFTAARSANKALGISGALLMRGDHFVQVLEGDEARVRPLYDKIAADRRHDEVELLEAGDVGARVFPRWSMAQVTADGDVPLIAHVDGIAPAAGHPTTAEQRELMEIMRAALSRSHQG